MTPKTLSMMNDVDPAKGPVTILGRQKGKSVRFTDADLEQSVSDVAIGDATASVAAALASKNAAKTSETNASQYATDANQSAVNAETHDEAAGVSAVNALNYRNAAEPLKNQAVVDATDADTYRNAAKASRDNSNTQSASANSSLKTVSDSYATAVANAARVLFQTRRATTLSQQDISDIASIPLHRSPNSIVAMCIYDTAQDSDGGAWINSSFGASWMYEPLVGKWLGQFASEMDARDYFGTLASPSIVTGDSSTFTNGVGGWTARNSNITVSMNSGKMRVVHQSSISAGAADLTVTGLVVGQRYQIAFSRTQGGGTTGNLFADVRTVASGGGSSVMPGGGNVNLGGAPGPNYVSFVASQTTHYVAISDSNAWAVGAYWEIDNFTIKSVDFTISPSGAYYQDFMDSGKHKRLWKNLIRSSRDMTGTGWQLQNQTGSASRNGNTITFGQGTTDLLYTSAGGQISLPIGVPLTVSWKLSGTGTVRIGGYSGVGTGRGNTDIALTATPTWYTTTFTNDVAGTGIGCYLGGTAVGPSTVVVDGVQLEIGSTTTAQSNEEVKDGSNLSQSEVFRGNKAEFPRVAGIVVEQTRLVIYDLLEPGQPMWMVFITNSASAAIRSAGAMSSVAAVNGSILVGSNYGVSLLDFVSDTPWAWSIGGKLRYRGNISQRNAVLSHDVVSSASIANQTVNAVAITVLPNAPIDPVTGLQIPTIGVAVGSGNGGQLGTVIMNDGSAITYSQANSDGSYVGFTQKYDVTWGITGSTGIFVMPLATANVSLVSAVSRIYGSVSSVNTGGSVNKKTVGAGTLATIGRAGGDLRVSLIRENPGSINSGLSAAITPMYNTGWMSGDIRRVWMSDVVPGAMSDANLVTNGSFDVDTSGWTPGASSTLSVEGGRLKIVGANQNASISAKAINLPVGFYYELSYDAQINDSSGSTDAIRVGVSSGIYNGPANIGPGDGWATRKGTFYVGSTTNSVEIIVYGAADTVAYIDNIRITRIASDRSHKAKSLNVFGTLSLNAVASAAQLVAYSGFSADSSFSNNRISNGGFDSDTVWSKGTDWSISGGVASKVAGTVTSSISQTCLKAGAFYEITMDVTRTAGNWRIDAGGIGAEGRTSFFTTSGNQKVVVKATGTVLYLTGDNLFAGSFDNVIVRQIDALGTTANVLQEAYSSDLDFNAGSQYWPMWASLPSTMPDANFPRGSEIVANGGFVDGTSWNAGTGVTISGGSANFSGVASGVGLSQTVATSFISGRSYEVSFTISGYVSGNGVAVRLGGTGAFYNTSGSNGLKKVIVQAGGSNASLVLLESSGNGTYTIDDVSVKELLPAYAFDRSAVSGPSIKAGVRYEGKLEATMYDGTTTRTVATDIPYNTGQFFSWGVAYTTDGTLSIIVGPRVAKTVTGAPLLTMNNTNAVTTVGNARTMDAPWPGSICLFKPTATIPTSDAIAWIYEQEKQMFRDGAQIKLPDTSTLMDLSYDPSTDSLYVYSGSYESVINGLVLNSYPVSAGSFTKAVSQSRHKLVARTGTNSGADFSLQTANIINQLKRLGNLDTLEEAIFDFDSTTGQTDFSLPVGWEIARVSVAGLVKQEGSTKDWTRIFDGFKETVRFAVAPGNGVYVQILAVKA